MWYLGALEHFNIEKNIINIVDGVLSEDTQKMVIKKN